VDGKVEFLSAENPELILRFSFSRTGKWVRIPHFFPVVYKVNNSSYGCLHYLIILLEIFLRKMVALVKTSEGCV
jgi:hypothetical protein